MERVPIGSFDFTLEDAVAQKGHDLSGQLIDSYGREVRGEGGIIRISASQLNSHFD